MRSIYPHHCCDGHVQIGHIDSGDDERCPLCRTLAIAAQQDERIRALEADIREWCEHIEPPLRDRIATLERELAEAKQSLDDEQTETVRSVIEHYMNLDSGGPLGTRWALNFANIRRLGLDKL